MNSKIFLVAPMALVIGALALPTFARQDPPQEEKIKDNLNFVTDIKPIIKKTCYGCHSGDTPAAGKDLSKKDAFKATSSDDQKAYFVKKGDPDHSTLVWQLEKRFDTKQMPPKKPMNDHDIKVIKAWIKQGAKPGVEPTTGGGGGL